MATGGPTAADLGAEDSPPCTALSPRCAAEALFFRGCPTGRSLGQGPVEGLTGPWRGPSSAGEGSGTSPAHGPHGHGTQTRSRRSAGPCRAPALRRRRPRAPVPRDGLVASVSFEDLHADTRARSFRTGHLVPVTVLLLSESAPDANESLERGQGLCFHTGIGVFPQRLVKAPSVTLLLGLRRVPSGLCWAAPMCLLVRPPTSAARTTAALA